MCLQGQGAASDSIPADTVILEDVTVKTMPFRESYLESTGGIHVVPPGRIRDEYIPAAASLFNTIPGIYMARGSENTNRLVIRGIGSRTPYSTNRIRAYLDGIPLTSGEGVSTLEDLDLASFGSLEILKGPSSALYGSGLGGVVMFSSAYPAEGTKGLEVIGEAGSFATARTGVTGFSKGDRNVLNGGIIHSSSRGFRENSRYSRTNLFLTDRYFGKKHSLEMTLHAVNLYAEIPSSLSEDDFISEPEKAGGDWGNINGYEKSLRLMGGLTLESRLAGRIRNNLTVFSTCTDPYERRPFNTLDERSVNAGAREQVSFQSERIGVSAGFEYFQEWYRWQIYETLPSSHGAMESDLAEVRRYLNGFTLVQWKPWHRVLVDGALNLNLLDYRLETRYASDSAYQDGHYRYRPVYSPRLGISFAHNGNVRTYMALGHGFSAPSLEETLLPEGIINTSLRPETGWNVEWGNRGILAGGRLRYDVSAYLIFLRDMLVTERISEDIFTGINAGSARNAGLEVWMQAMRFPEGSGKRFNAGISTGYSLSKNLFKDFADDGTDYSGNDLPGIPSQVLSTEVTGTTGEFGISLRYHFTGSQWMNDTNDKLYGGYHLFHLQLSWEHAFGTSPFTLRIFGTVRNLFNASYAAMILINAPSFGDRAPRYYYPGSPREFILGIRITLRK
jgi:iron complex outermembrane receptor protein